MRTLAPLVAGCLLAVAAAASAELEVRFIEGAPKDRFTVRNAGTCDPGPFELVIDLSPSAAGLVFDTTGRGAGVEVYQPFEVAEGRLTLTSGTRVRDGDDRLSVHVPGLAPGERVAFTIDVDDTLPASELGQIRVSSSEIAGGIAHVTAGDAVKVSGTFDRTGRMVLDAPGCE